MIDNKKTVFVTEGAVFMVTKMDLTKWINKLK